MKEVTLFIQRHIGKWKVGRDLFFFNFKKSKRYQGEGRVKSNDCLFFLKARKRPCQSAQGGPP